MANLAITNASSSGVDITTPAASASAGGDSFVNTGRELLVIKNGDVAPHTVTFVTPMTVDGQAVADKAVVVTNAHEMIIGPFQPSIYNDNGQAGGNISFTYDAVTSVTVQVIKVAAQ